MHTLSLQDALLLQNAGFDEAFEAGDFHRLELPLVFSMIAGDRGPVLTGVN
jgi:hypothetical protein